MRCRKVRMHNTHFRTSPDTNKQIAPAPEKTRRQNHTQYSAQWSRAAQSPSDESHSLCWKKKRESGVHLLAMSFTLSLRVFLSRLFLILCLFSLCTYIHIYIYIYPCVCKHRGNAHHVYHWGKFVHTFMFRTKWLTTKWY